MHLFLLFQSILSQATQKVDQCMDSVHPDNPSITLGRCIHLTAQKFCTQKGGVSKVKPEMLLFFIHNVKVRLPRSLRGNTSRHIINYVLKGKFTNLGSIKEQETLSLLLNFAKYRLVLEMT